MKPDWLLRYAKPRALTTQSAERVRMLSEELRVSEHIVIDAAARVVTPEQVREVVVRDASDLVRWRLRK